MLTPLLLLGSLLIGPEVIPPARATEPVYAWHAAAVGIDDDFLVVWSSSHAVWSRRLGDSGVPSRVALVQEPGLDPLRLASTRSSIVALWPELHALRAASLTRDGGVIETHDVVANDNLLNASLTAFGDGYLAVWTTWTETRACFLNAHGAPDGASFLIHARADSLYSAASNGTTALVALGTGLYSIDRGGHVALVSSLRAVELAWDGTVFIAVSYGSVNALDSSGRVLRTTPIGLTGRPHVVVNSDGAAVIFENAYGDGATALRLALGGAPLDERAFPILREPRMLTAAWNGDEYALLFGYDFQFTTLRELTEAADAPQPVVLAEPTPYAPALASGTQTTFLGWSERTRTVVARFRDVAYLGETNLPLGQLAMTARGDEAGVLSAGDDVRGFVVRNDGSVRTDVRLGYGASGPFSLTPRGIAAVDGTYLALWSRNGPSQPGGLTYTSSIESSSFDEEAHAFDLGYTAPIVNRGDYATVAYTDPNSVLWLVDVDAHGRMLGSRVRIAEHAANPALAVDDTNALFLAWSDGEHIVATNFVQTLTLPMSGRPHVAWTGDEFLIANDNLDLVRITRNGERRGAMMHIATPFPTSDVQLTRNAIAYIRAAPDLGYVSDRVVVRTITSTTPRSADIRRPSP
ncbi:MAG TPA: hypothetical protein VJZ00_09690 [Thermoanaerobaculia bacterium]|nr:hypothetical protein [Thermoanaerobaculia bacterium]